MTDRKFNAAERRRYRQAGLLLAVGVAMVAAALVWQLADAFSGGDGIPGAWLTAPGALLAFGGMGWSTRTLRSASERWRADR